MGGTKRDNRALFRPVIVQSAAVLEAIKARPGNVGVRLYGGATAGLDSLCARRPPNSNGRGGRKPAARSNKRKRQARKKALGIRKRRLETGSMAPVEQKDGGLPRLPPFGHAMGQRRSGNISDEAPG